MILLQFGEDFGHDGLTEEGGFGVHLEAGAILVNGGELTGVEIEHIAVFPEQQFALLLQVGGVYARDFFTSGHISEISRLRSK